MTKLPFSFLLNHRVFTLTQALQWFPEVRPRSIRVMLSRWMARGIIKNVRRGVYVVTTSTDTLNEFVLAPLVFEPSYISMESALHAYGMLTDIPFVVTSVTTKVSRSFSTPFGVYLYRSFPRDQFFGFTHIVEPGTPGYDIATPEKALLDFFAAHPKEHAEDLRISLSPSFSPERFDRFLQAYSARKQQQCTRMLRQVQTKEDHESITI